MYNLVSGFQHVMWGLFQKSGGGGNFEKKNFETLKRRCVHICCLMEKTKD